MMRQFLCVFLFFCFSHALFSQTPDGPYKSYYESGELKTEGQYRNNKRIGNWKSYFKNGQASSEYSYDNNGKRNKEAISYYESGAVKYKTELQSAEYIRSGYFETGELKSESQIKDGYYKEFLKDGTLRIESEMVDYQLSGLWKRYYSEGIIEWVVNYTEGYRSGDFKNYYKNGNLKIEGRLKNDKTHGEELRYNEQEIIEWKGYNAEGKLNKTWTKYNEEGNKVEKFKYKNGALLSKKGEVKLIATEVPDGIFEKVPLYPGCETVFGNKARKKCMSEKVSRHVNTKFNTDLALKINAYGKHKVIVKFKIDKTGSVKDIKAITPILVFEVEAKRVINLLPKMKPGIQDGEVVEVPYSLPIIFQVVK